MKILKLTAENFKKLSAVEISPEGNIVMITGKNAAGKSSLLDSIEAALCGGRNLPKQPIKSGEQSGQVTTVLGDNGQPAYTVTRKFLGTGSKLVVEAFGDTISEVRSPQTFLDDIVGAISFDPLKFSKKDPREQRQILLDFLGIDLDEYDKQIASLKERRSEKNKERHLSEREAELITFTPNLPPAEVKADALLAKLNSINQHNQNRERILQANETTTNRIQDTRKEIDKAFKAIEEWQKRLGDLQLNLKILQDQIVAVPKQQSSAEVESDIKKQADINEAIRANSLKKQIQSRVSELTTIWTQLGNEVKAAEHAKAKKMAEAVMPIKGLSIRPDGLAYNNIPLEQVNGAKQLEVCVAISMALNPKLKVIRINGNDLDKESLMSLAKMVDNKGYQIWIEKVSDDKGIGFYIEDGTLCK
jgi:DNA repair exonuclease SbcCD ATPase subunit